MQSHQPCGGNNRKSSSHLCGASFGSPCFCLATENIKTERQRPCRAKNAVIEFFRPDDWGYSRFSVNQGRQFCADQNGKEFFVLLVFFLSVYLQQKRTVKSYDRLFNLNRIYNFSPNHFHYIRGISGRWQQIQIVLSTEGKHVVTKI